MTSFISNLTVIIVLIIVLFFSLKGTISHFKGEGSCCGGGGSDVKTKPKKLKQVLFEKTIKIDGMHCEHCYTRVSNALNSLDGVSAKVYGKKGKALVRFEKNYSDEELTKVITDLGYTVKSIEKKG